MAKKIKLTQGQYAIVDDNWYEYLSNWKWNAQYSPITKSYYAVRSQNTGDGKKVSVKMARIIMETSSHLVCHHKNHNTLDNRKRNLENITRQKNAEYRKGAQRNSTTGENNIYHYSFGYRVLIQRFGKFVFNKTFKTLLQAKRARNKFLRS